MRDAVRHFTRSRLFLRHDVHRSLQSDSLWKIAQKFYGNGSVFKRIIEANPDKLEDENSVIHPGDELKIPAAG